MNKLLHKIVFGVSQSGAGVFFITRRNYGGIGRFGL